MQEDLNKKAHKTTRTSNHTVYLSEKLKMEATQFCSAYEIPFSQLIRAALREYLNNHKTE